VSIDYRTRNGDCAGVVIDQSYIAGRIGRAISSQGAVVRCDIIFLCRRIFICLSTRRCVGDAFFLEYRTETAARKRNGKKARSFRATTISLRLRCALRRARLLRLLSITKRCWPRVIPRVSRELRKICDKCNARCREIAGKKSDGIKHASCCAFFPLTAILRFSTNFVHVCVRARARARACVCVDPCFTQNVYQDSRS